MSKYNYDFWGIFKVENKIAEVNCVKDRPCNHEYNDWYNEFKIFFDERSYIDWVYDIIDPWYVINFDQWTDNINFFLS